MAAAVMAAGADPVATVAVGIAQTLGRLVHDADVYAALASHATVYAVSAWLSPRLFAGGASLGPHRLANWNSRCGAESEERGESEEKAKRKREERV